MNSDRLVSAGEAARLLSVSPEEFIGIARMAGGPLNPVCLPGLEDPFRWRLSLLWDWIHALEVGQAIPQPQISAGRTVEPPVIVRPGVEPPLPTYGQLFEGDVPVRPV